MNFDTKSGDILLLELAGQVALDEGSLGTVAMPMSAHKKRSFRREARAEKGKIASQVDQSFARSPQRPFDKPSEVDLSGK